MDIEWDFGPDDVIEYFDIRNSYFITHYRPINDTQGKDFDPDWFRQSAITKLRTGRYTNSVIGSKANREFWKEEIRRCNEGHTVKGYRITGDHYFFLNFYNLKTSDADTINQAFGFPMFLVFQYEYFHYLEMAEKLGKDVSVLKSRGIGLSEIISATSVRPYTTIPNFRTVVTAFSKGLLNPTLDKIWYQMDWLNDNTETALKRVRMVINTKTHKRASIKDSDLSERGHRSEIEGIIVDDPDKLRGDRIQLLIYEEAGADPYLIKKWVKGEALITVLGGKRVGRRIAFGTGGSSKAGSMEGLKKMTLNPKAYNILPFKHNFTTTKEEIITGYFIPAYRIAFHLIDKRGFCNREDSTAYYESERSLRASDPKDLMDYQSEYCFTIEEAVLQKEGGLFPREELAEQLTAIEVFKNVDKPKRGFLTWEVDSSNNRTGKVKWRGDSSGNVQITEQPLIGENGESYNNLYVGGIDSIDIGAADSATLNESQLSKFCIVIKKRVLGLSPPEYVAMYLDRPRDPREAYENAAKLLIYYNAKAVLESTRTAIITHFRNKKYLYLLMKRPRSTLSDVTKTNTNMVGAPSNTRAIEHGRELVYEFCLEYANTIKFKNMIEQLLNYTDAEKGKFDIVASMQMAELADEELSSKRPVEREAFVKSFTDFGWWTDDYGYKHYGAIPKNSYERNERRRTRTSDTWLYKEDL